MRFRMAPVDVGFLDSAPVRLRYRAEAAAAPEAVFGLLSSDPGGWAGWFPGVAGGGYTGPAPHGVGTGRRVRMVGGGGFEETVVSWEAPRRYAYRVDSASYPMARALLEGWTIEPAHGGGSVVEWTFAVDPAPAFRAFLAVGGGVMGAVFRRAVRNLDRRLSSPG